MNEQNLEKVEKIIKTCQELYDCQPVLKWMSDDRMSKMAQSQFDMISKEVEKLPEFKEKLLPAISHDVNMVPYFGIQGDSGELEFITPKHPLFGSLSDRFEKRQNECYYVCFGTRKEREVFPIRCDIEADNIFKLCKNPDLVRTTEASSSNGKKRGQPPSTVASQEENASTENPNSADGSLLRKPNATHEILYLDVDEVQDSNGGGMAVSSVGGEAEENCDDSLASGEERLSKETNAPGEKRFVDQRGKKRRRRPSIISTEPCKELDERLAVQEEEECHVIRNARPIISKMGLKSVHDFLVPAFQGDVNANREFVNNCINETSNMK
eukprot:Nk52_evm3s360 gene=Nk52_evmTU3s360